MTLGTSLNKNQSGRHVFFQTLKRNKPLLLTYSIICFVFLPLMNLITEYIPRHDYSSIWRDEFSITSVFIFFPVVAVMPVIVVGMVFSYLYNRPAVDVYHSLGITREKLFVNQYIAGLIIYTVPFVLAYLLNMLFAFLFGGSGYHLSVQLLNMIEVLYTGVLLYSLAVFVAVNTGNVFDYLVYTFVLLVSSPIIYAIIEQYNNTFLYGYRYSDKMDTGLFVICPPLLMIRLLTDNGDFNFTYFSSYIAVAFILLMVGLASYKVRKSEQAGKTKTDSIMSIIVKLLVCLICSAGLGLYIHSINGGKMSVIIGIVLGLLVSHFIIEVIISRGLKTIKKSIVYCGVMLVVLLSGSIFYLNGGFGFETKVPNLDEIDSVEFNIQSSNNYYGDTINRINMVDFHSEEDIKIVQEIHEVLINDKNSYLKKYETPPEPLENGRYDQSFNPYIVYKLKNGSIFKRYYPNHSYSKLIYQCPNFVKLFDSKEYKEKNDIYANVEISSIRSVLFSNKLEKEMRILPNSQSFYQGLLKAMSNDMRSMSFEERYISKKPQLGTIRLDVSEYKYKNPNSMSESLSFILYQDSYTHKYLLENTKDVLKPIEQSYEKVFLFKSNSNKLYGDYGTIAYNNESSKMYISDSYDSLKPITDKALINKLIASGYLFYGQEYITKQKNGYLLTIPEGNDTSVNRSLYIPFDELPKEALDYIS